MRDGNHQEQARRQAIVDAAAREAEAALADRPRSLGFCHLLWQTQKRILREKYGIDWKTPAEERPHVLFD